MSVARATEREPGEVPEEEIDTAYGFEVRVPVTGGPHDVGVGFLKTCGSVGLVRNGYRKRFERPYRFNADVMGILMPFVETVSITGPFNATGPGDTPSRRAVFTCRPTAAADEDHSKLSRSDQ